MNATPATRRIAVAGFQHETNTFAPYKAGIAEFEMADSWPALLVGQDVILGTTGMTLPIAGAISAATAQLLPILWAAAEPSGHVTDDAFDRISGMILEGLKKAGPLDGLYLDLHGAMVTESHFDGEAELLRRIRALIGPVPIAISLDLHANISADLAALADVITIYRTYPHLDMAETGARAMRALDRVIAKEHLACAFRQAPFLIPLSAQFTGAEPCQSLYALLDALPGEAEHIDLALGFSAADIPACGPSIVAYAADTERAEALADALLQALLRAETQFQTALHTPQDAVRRARHLPGTVVLADVQDNPGAGGASDSTGMLHALRDVPEALIGVVWDPLTAATAHRLGEGATFDGALGGRSGPEGVTPFEAQFRVLALSDGRIAYTGEMYGGGIAEVGPSCLLQAGGLKIVVSSVRTQCLDLAFFCHFGLDPARAKIVCVKSTVHFRADFDPISSAVLNVAAPGHFPCKLTLDHYQNLRPGVRCLPD